jgi:hypothetical protein
MIMERKSQLEISNMSEKAQLALQAWRDAAAAQHK